MVKICSFKFRMYPLIPLNINVPKYILEDPIYHGGVEIHIGRIKEISNHGRYL